jgi:hypothetical protein
MAIPSRTIAAWQRETKTAPTILVSTMMRLGPGPRALLSSTSLARAHEASMHGSGEEHVEARQ